MLCKERSFRPLLTQVGDVPDARLERTTACKTETLSSITHSSSIRPLLTQLGDVPDLRLERANRPLHRIGFLIISLRRLGDVPELES